MTKILVARNIKDTLRLYCSEVPQRSTSYYWVTDVEKDEVLEEGYIDRKIASYWDQFFRPCDPDGNFRR